MMIHISNTVKIQDWEYTLSTMSSQGPGGQNVNKVSTAVHLRFDIHSSSLAEKIKEKLLKVSDQKITKEGVLVIKSQTNRSQEQNKLDAIEKLRQFIVDALKTEKPRKATRATRSSQKKRLDQKTERSQIKALRGRVRFEE